MKKILLFILMLFAIEISYAQIQNITDLSTGVLSYSSRLADEESNVIGYVFIFNKGLINNEKEIQYEYIIADNNLNKITNGDFELRNIPKLGYKYKNVKFYKQKLYIDTRLYHVKNFGEYGDILVNIDLKTNKTENPMFFRNEGFSSFSDLEGFDKMKVLNGVFASFNHLTMYQGKDQFYYFDIATGSDFSLETIKAYNENFENTFSYDLDKDMRKSGYKFGLQALNDNSIIIIQRKYNNNSSNNVLQVERLLGYNLNDGQKFFNVIYNANHKQSGFYAFPKTEMRNDKVLVIGEVKEAYEGVAPSSNQVPTIGILRSIYDMKGNLLLEKQTDFKVIFQDLGFKTSRDKDGYKFVLKEFFNYNDNSFTVLLEKQKGDGTLTIARTTDYIIANFDANGNFVNHILLEKSKLKMFDSYLFSQENKEENEVLFFYGEPDKDDKKTWNLIINKLKNGVLTQDKMPFKTKDSSIRFGKAKYGYIYVSEYNKEDKERSIRIEKLNL